MREIPCRACSGTMRKRTIGDSALAGLIFSIIIFVFGLTLFLLIPVLGWLIGGAMMIYALFRSTGKKRRVWKCRQCGAVIERA